MIARTERTHILKLAPFDVLEAIDLPTFDDKELHARVAFSENELVLFELQRLKAIHEFQLLLLVEGVKKLN
jgi:hypothetical protein